jgi:hypothetical protein
MKPALFLLLCTCAGVSAASAQTVIPLPWHHAPEIEWATASSALIVLASAIAIMRGRRKR